MDERVKEEYPKLRAGIEVYPASLQGRKVIILHDRLGLSPDLALVQESAHILALLDGHNSFRDIQVELMRRFGFGLISSDEIRRLIEELDRHFLLDNEGFYAHKERVADSYRRERVRRPFHAGRTYDADPEKLMRMLDDLFSPPQGPGPIEVTSSTGRLRGLIAPHIDFRRGGSCYAWAYKELVREGDADLFIILGTCHFPSSAPFILTDKAFETPFGRINSDVEIINEVLQTSGIDLLQDELVHRTEHTIEFHVIFLQYALGGRGNFEIFPVLCGGFHEMLEERVLPEDKDAYRRGLDALGEAMAKSRRKICVIASADLTHLGPQFGDPMQVLRGELPSIERDDMDMLEHVLKLRPEGFYRHILTEGDRRRICGLPPIYTLLRLVRADRASLLNYSQAYDPQATVTFASISLTEGN